MSDRSKNTGRVALVTGAGSRVGRAIALGLAADGYALGVHFNASREGADRTVSEIEAAGGEAVALQHDLSEPEGAGHLIKMLARHFGPAAVLVNSAAVFDEDSIATLDPESWHRITNVNLAAPVFLMQAFSAQPEIPDNAAIVNILDTQMSSPYPGRFSYFTAKFGLEGATKVAAFDLAQRGITVNAIAPGLVLPSGQTEEEYRHRQELTPLGRGLGPQDIVGAVRYLIGARQVTGLTLRVDAGQHLMGFGNTPTDTPSQG